MRCVISTDGDMVSAHFGRCPEFTVVDIENGEVQKTEVIPNPGHNPGYLPEYFGSMKADCIIAGGMGQMALGLFAAKKIKPIVGVTGSVAEVIEKLKKGTLEGAESLCNPGGGKGYGLDKSECDHEKEEKK
ncbi:MAG: NifB/NifX family molybdenum-iron cluster-binding protein [Elusimicrobiota bacterium]|nr:NifB/NifX family molybdenum-iron cluster-binding protein [Elusimicrobiota bacterium]